MKFLNKSPLNYLKIPGQGPKLSLKYARPPELPLTMADGAPMGLDLRDMKNGTHLTCGNPNCNGAAFNIVKLNDVVCVGCAKCEWESYIHLPDIVQRNLLKL